jgi:hypothetical protein
MAIEFVPNCNSGVGLTVGHQQHAVRRLSARVAKLVLEGSMHSTSVTARRMPFTAERPDAKQSHCGWAS